ncbi:hypothetical protein Tco_0890506 [Tanacetum coccineum]|uniref:Uncharacterized protein n=1 Tax=Tanacetum coccineum TaxID=301880 RepID=A0ABQ5C236_9ASTR
MSDGHKKNDKFWVSGVLTECNSKKFQKQSKEMLTSTWHSESQLPKVLRRVQTGPRLRKVAEKMWIVETGSNTLATVHEVINISLNIWDLGARWHLAITCGLCDVPSIRSSFGRAFHPEAPFIQTCPSSSLHPDARFILMPPLSGCAFHLMCPLSGCVFRSPFHPDVPFIRPSSGRDFHPAFIRTCLSSGRALLLDMPFIRPSSGRAFHPPFIRTCLSSNLHLDVPFIRALHPTTNLKRPSKRLISWCSVRRIRFMRPHTS